MSNGPLRSILVNDGGGWCDSKVEGVACSDQPCLVGEVHAVTKYYTVVVARSYHIGMGQQQQ